MVNSISRLEKLAWVAKVHNEVAVGLPTEEKLLKCIEEPDRGQAVNDVVWDI
jgi:hypothetical protein